jgi:outer membrane lipoprotein-sorting protein
VRDLKNHKSHVLEFDVVAQRPHNVRLEISTPLGFHMASLVMNEKQIAYALNREKRFYRGKPSEKSLRPLLAVDLHPKLLVNLLFDISPEGKDWQCQSKQGTLESCKNEKLKMSLDWDKRDGHKKLVRITAPRMKMQMQFRSFDKRESIDSKTFVLSPPKDFKVYRLIQ